MFREIRNGAMDLLRQCKTESPAEVDLNLRPCCQQPSYSTDNKVLETFRNLVTLYKSRTGNDNGIQTGGIQQFVNKHMPRTTQLQTSVSCVNNELVDSQQHSPSDSDLSVSVFHLIPLPCKLHIFSFLGAEDLCNAAKVCSDWSDIASDEILWKHKLERDMWIWDEISNLTNPDAREEVVSDRSFKDIYLRCAPEMKTYREEVLQFPAFGWTSLYKKFLPKKPPRIGMFGPGLESSTSKLVRNVMYEDSKVFKKKKMFPGISGIGSGFTIEVNDKKRLDLITLYSNTYAVRRNNPQQRLHHNQLMQHVAEVEKGSQDDFVELELQQAVRGLCRTMHGFVFVVDATSSQQIVSEAASELHAMVSTRWSDNSLPVVVLSCTPEQSSSRLSCLSIVRSLRLARLNRPWKVMSCSVDCLESIAHCLTWVIDESSS